MLRINNRALLFRSKFYLTLYRIFCSCFLMMKDKTITIVFLLAAALTLVGQISVNIAQHQAEAFSLTSLPLGAYTVKPPSSSSGGSNNLSVQNQVNTGNNAL